MPKDQSVSPGVEKPGRPFSEAGDLLRSLLRIAVGDEGASYDRILERFAGTGSRPLQEISKRTLERWLSGASRPRGRNWEALRRFLVGSGPIERQPGGVKEAIAALDFLYRVGEARKAGKLLPSPDEAPEMARAYLEEAQRRGRRADLVEKATTAAAYLERVFPRRLGRLKERQRERPGTDHPSDERQPSRGHRTHEGLRESARAAVDRYETTEILAGDALLDRLLTSPTGRAGFALVLGEPGGGKTTLLQAWYARRLQAATNSEPDTAYVRLSKLARISDSQAPLEDRLIEIARGDGVAGIKAPPVPGRPALWLLDGLDEAAAAAIAADLAALPGLVIVSCRTSVWEGLSADVKRHVDPSAHWEIQQLGPDEQVVYLAELDRRPIHRLWPRAEAEELVRRIGTNIQMREIAGSPLLLDLIGEVGQEIELPASRAELFEQGFQRYWNRRLPGPDSGKPAARVKALSGQRDRILQDLAGRMTEGEPSKPWDLQVRLKVLEEAIEAQAGVGDVVTWIEAFRASGILSLNDEIGRVGFAHLAFQEYALARHWLETLGFTEALDRYWADLRAEEALGLMIGIAAEWDAAAVDQRLTDFSVSWLERHRKDPEGLWGIGRSPGRAVCHLLGRSGVQLNRFPEWSDWLSRFMSGSAQVRLALASDERSPAEVLARLAGDVDMWVRRAVAGNATSPAEVLARLANDDEMWVRRAVAGNATSPAEVLARLANDDEMWVRRAVAENGATPAEVLARLANDDEMEMRIAVAGNSASPAEVLARLAGDDGQRVRRAVAGNASSPAEVLARLAGDDEDERGAVAGNAASPAEVLARLAGDDERWVRLGVAENTATPAEVLARLASDSEPSVRAAVAENAATPADVLARLAGDDEKVVRRGVTWNAAAPAKVLARLAGDNEMEVRWAVAANGASPAEVLARLAGDDEKAVRVSLAENAATLLEDLYHR